ncbi:MAG TPA: CDP-diacylglycerol--glycerol-3-phosphate 3-phosphatidyltransferase [Treponema sp.]|nr:CDP-diacylglycerol--glycerol-3-phosphate 3-phosphatidyltransferase [Treponema sp.]
MKASNKFTFARIIAAPIFFVIYFIPVWLNLPAGHPFSIASVCFLIPLLGFAELTDYWDGHFARKNNEVSDFGKMFDPFADVFLHLSTFTCFTFTGATDESRFGYMPVSCYIIILYREFSQNFLRMACAKQGTAVAARKGGKIKTVFYVISCFVASAQESLYRLNLAATFDLPMQLFKYIGWGFFTVCVFLALASFFDYMKNFGHVLHDAAQ